MKFQIRNVLIPEEGSIVVLNRYWLCLDNYGTRALFYGFSPQCNRSRGITNWLLENSKDKVYPEGVRVVFIYIAYIPKLV